MLLLALYWLSWTVQADSGSLPAPLQQYLQHKGQLRYCVDPNWLPFEGLDASGRHTGMSAGYQQFFQTLLPVPLTLTTTTSWSESLQAIYDGRCDFLLLAMATAERQKYLAFSTTYLTIPSAVVTLANQAPLGELQQMTTARMGIRRDVGFVPMYRSQWPHMQLIEVQSYEKGLLMVQSGQLDGMFGNMGSLSYLLQQYKMRNLKIAALIDGDSKMGIASRRNEPQLAQIADWLVGQITPELQQQLTEQWLPLQIDHRNEYQLALQVLAIAVFALGLIGWAYHKLVRLNQRLLASNARLAEQSQHDGLTGLYNRQYLSHKLPELLALCERQQLTLTLAMIDLDHFKRLNDQHGHLFGDECLRCFAQLFGMHFQRPGDVLVRYGGEEFVLLSVGNQPSDMAQKLQQFIKALATKQVEHLQQQAVCTASIGWVLAVPKRGDRVEAWLQAADEALYQAKAAGRNCTVQSESLVSRMK